MITRVYPDPEFEAGVEAYVRDLADKPGIGVEMTKELLYEIDGMRFQAAMEAASG